MKTCFHLLENLLSLVWTDKSHELFTRRALHSMCKVNITLPVVFFVFVAFLSAINDT